ncbi:hypothetical protein [Nonomuraea soli]|uniref:WD40 repeat domain-containing protein n=1 Tax=Nonomuraea soli TaxID=1032476 RepID=A0A7W0CI70_9ACTN|nr:hypothetical protein [Nonomuraea soli]MBA2891628.1 hypothetical protein [Nonomuraea soli]
MRDERELGRVIGRGVQTVAPPSDLLAGVTRRRRRRARRQMVFTAAAVVMVVAGSSLAFWREAPRVGVQPVPSVDQQWPEAVVKLPVSSADGKKYRPVAALGATRILVAVESGVRRIERLEIFDTVTRSFRVLGTTPQATTARFEVGASSVAWSGPGGELWVMPLSGGTARRVGTARGEVGALSVTPTHLVWSHALTGVYRVPLDGGKTEEISDSLRLQAWPWAVSFVDGNPAMLHDLESGRRIKIDTASSSHVRCVPRWCIGLRSGALAVWRPDGSGLRFLAGSNKIGDILDGRFAISHPPRESVVLDLESGRTGVIRASSDFGLGWSYSTPTVVYWGREAGDQEFSLLNLLAVR